MTTCCEKELTTPYCPYCGTHAPIDPLYRVAAYLAEMRNKAGEWFTKAKEKYPDKGHATLAKKVVKLTELLDIVDNELTRKEHE